MIDDTAGILSHNNNNKDYSLNEIYSEENIKKLFLLGFLFHIKKKIKITENLEAQFLNAGHILGSAMVLFIYNGKKKLLQEILAIVLLHFYQMLKKLQILII